LLIRSCWTHAATAYSDIAIKKPARGRLLLK
jgi:hypothetical protein